MFNGKQKNIIKAIWAIQQQNTKMLKKSKTVRQKTTKNKTACKRLCTDYNKWMTRLMMY